MLFVFVQFLKELMNNSQTTAIRYIRYTLYAMGCMMKNGENSVVTCTSTVSCKRRAELQSKEKQAAKRRSKEVRRELELQSARHELELAKLEKEKLIFNERYASRYRTP
jgi:hypothetical protein